MSDPRYPSLYPSGPGRSYSRRSFLATTGSLAAAAVWASRAEGAVRRNVAFSDYPFKLGVASGDPSPDGLVLWTRLAPKPLEGGGMPAEPVEVDWQVAADEPFSKVVRQGKTTATPDWGHTVHVEVDGLEPGRWYWYQFKVGSETSPKGRTRTMPPADAAAPPLKFAFASCQHFETGYYTAYEHMLKDDLDLVLHLGDYIYEGAARDDRVRKHVGGKIETLDDYRNRYAQYRGDPALLAMHAAAPWIVTWDDHEVENNYAGPYPEDLKVSQADFLKRRALAYQAYYENMPLRRSALPHGPDMPLYRKLPFGRLANFYVLDTRQYRTDQPCGDGHKKPDASVYDEKAAILGDAQRKWLLDGLGSSHAKWNVLAQQVMVTRIDYAAGDVEVLDMDKWAGYEADRRRLLNFLAERKPANPVVLTGDIHTNWACDITTDYNKQDAKNVGVEFVGTSISSSGDGLRTPRNTETILKENPAVKLYNAQRGYVRCTVTPRQWRTDYQVVEYVTRKGAPVETLASFVVEDGQPRVQKA
ncbi:MAG TPA: alkaline phosphatase D family protein [Pirellulales bacterium]|nr:alkaline phosphatase D family protein [Pirellulales bacterium]